MMHHNGEHTAKYFKLEKRTHQGDPISAHLFIIFLEIVFDSIKENKKIHSLNFFEHNFLYKAYFHGTTFFLRR